MKSLKSVLLISLGLCGSISSSAQLSNALSITASGNLCSSDQTIIRFMTQATDSFDSDFDAYKSINPDNTPNIYTESDEKYAINALHDEFVEKIVALNFQVYFTGTYTFTAQQLGAFNDSWSIILVDQFLMKEINLRSDSTYTFTSQHTDASNRFLIKFNILAKASIVTALQLPQEQDKRIYASMDHIIVNVDNSTSHSMVYIRDLSGDKIIQTEISGTWSFQPEGNGIYIVDVVSDNQHYSKKVFVTN